ncbi:MAG: NUDIX hydrolase [Betaproteobacteria bacterium]|nr:NUDIX hydrolase [Betaproteobacteria bacterium]
MSGKVRLANPVSYPPHGDWDARLTAIACPGLTPVTTLHENEWFTVRDRGGYYTTEYHSSQVIVLPVVEDAGIVMIRAKRPVIGDTTLELPAGAIEDGELPVAGAAREFAEETGIAIPEARFRAMAPMSTSPNRVPKLVYVFRVDLSLQEFERRKPHDSEVESVHCVPLTQVVELITEGGIYVALPVAVIASYLLSRFPECRPKAK